MVGGGGCVKLDQQSKNWWTFTNSHHRCLRQCWHCIRCWRPRVRMASQYIHPWGQCHHGICRWHLVEGLVGSIGRKMAYNSTIVVAVGLFLFIWTLLAGYCVPPQFSTASATLRDFLCTDCERFTDSLVAIWQFQCPWVGEGMGWKGGNGVIVFLSPRGYFGFLCVRTISNFGRFCRNVFFLGRYFDMNLLIEGKVFLSNQAGGLLFTLSINISDPLH